MDLKELWTYTGIGAIGISSISFLLRSIKSDNSKIQQVTIDNLKEAVDARDLTIRDLIAKMDLDKESFNAQLEALKAQMASMQQQIGLLQQEKKTLEQTVTGQAQLTEIIAGQKQLIQGVDDIKGAVEANHRTND